VSCTYGGTQCSCEGEGDWLCSTCPAAQPAEGSACSNVSAMGINVCYFGPTQCRCEGLPSAAGTWSCSTCPATRPTPGSDCSSYLFVNNFLCLYPPEGCGPVVGCATPGEDCVCKSDGTWECGTTSCPMLQPTPGTSCYLDELSSCIYGAVDCVCMPGPLHQFFCN
jgi:hypothetical protein